MWIQTNNKNICEPNSRYKNQNIIDRTRNYFKFFFFIDIVMPNIYIYK